VKPDASSFVVGGGHAPRPPAAVIAKPVVVTRPPAAPRVVPRADAEPRSPAVSVPAPRVVTAPRPVTPTQAPRPPFGASSVERERPPEPQRLEPVRRPDAPATSPPDAARRPDAAQPVTRERPDNRAKGGPPPSGGPRDSAGPRDFSGPRDQAPPPHRAGRQPDQSPSTERAEAPRPSRGQLPGEPASRVFPGRSERSQPGQGGGPGSGSGQGPGEGRGPR
jgi:translation initiation factor IF-2